MRPRHINPLRILLIFFLFLCVGCSDSDPATSRTADDSAAKLLGAWQQTAIGSEKVSGIVVKIIFSKDTLTMDAPGCLIIGDYLVDDNILTYTVTSVEGERCATGQIGKKDSVNFSVTDTQLVLTPLLAGEERQSEYKRIGD